MHHHHRHKLLIALSTTTPCKFSTIDLEAPQDGPTPGRPLPFQVEHERVEIFLCIRGLVCLRMFNKCNGRIYSDFVLWNPLTSEYKTVSRPNNKECYVTTATLFGFYYSCNDYKLLLVTKNHNVYIYSLKSDSWRKLETTQEDLSLLRPHLIYGWWEQPVLLNEKLYFKSIEANHIATGNLISIISFDVKTEKWKKMVAPDIGNGYYKTSSTILVVRGCIHVYAIYDGESETNGFVTELWRMDGDGDWTKVTDTFNRPDCFPLWIALYPLHLTKNGNWVMHLKFYGLKTLYEADLQMHTKKCVYMYHRDAIVITQRGIYTETLGINMFKHP
ncbi:hypothetical protein OSB04_013722 [Centaurea solstitialis]|uniref:F-box associated beta-propeller type 1 domain-containing protein n=1 Tax=Centaurea solstitialis TaxID=347529 RepID=A0AA38TDT4_9ASTR|nr:hypothetical protein OSB04_013722 [Centaurea solstitialis]